MPPDRTALRRYTRWLPSLVLLVVCIAWWSPLGVIAALAATVATHSLLTRFDLAGDVLPVGGVALRSAPLSPFARQPPAGDVTLGWAELGMGGPAYCTQMLRDGAIVDDVACDGGTAQTGTWTDLAGTSLRLASGYVDRSEVVLGYDEQRKVVLHFKAVPHVFWQMLGERRQADGDAAAAAWVSRQPHVATALRAYHGLWLAPDDPALASPMQGQLRRHLPDGRELSARLLLPDDLRLTAHPDLFTHTQPYALALDGMDSGRHVCDLHSVIASPGGHCLPGCHPPACGGRVAGVLVWPLAGGVSPCVCRGGRAASQCLAGGARRRRRRTAGTAGLPRMGGRGGLASGAAGGRCTGPDGGVAADRRISGRQGPTRAAGVAQRLTGRP